MEIIKFEAKREDSVIKPEMEDNGKRRYYILTKSFLSGKFRGQLDSVYKTRDVNPGKVAEFRRAIAYGDIVIPRCTEVQVEKCRVLGIEVPESLRPPKRVPKPKVERKYWILNKTFLSGKFRGQLDSVYKTRDVNPGKVAEFRKAVSCGDVKITEVLTPVQMKKCEVMGVEVPEEFRPVIVERPPKPKVERRYWILNRGFLSGKFKGQLDSVYKTRVENPGKVDEFRKAIAYGDVKFTERLTQVQMKKCEELGIIVPDEYRYVPPVKKSVAQKVPNLAEI